MRRSVFARTRNSIDVAGSGGAVVRTDKGLGRREGMVDQS
jgi:hypothetical protein